MEYNIIQIPKVLDLISAKGTSNFQSELFIARRWVSVVPDNIVWLVCSENHSNVPRTLKLDKEL
jgi:hypothetical protein